MAQPFSRYKSGLKVPSGSVLKYIKGQGYTYAPAKAAAIPAPPASKPFDYGQTLKNEGIFAADSADIGASNTAAQVSRDNAIKALRFQYSDPNNPFSSLGEAERDRKRAVANMLANRGARGVGVSGGTTLAQMDIGHDYSKGLYDITNALSGQIGSQDAQLADTLRQNKAALSGALKDAQGRLVDAGIAGSTPLVGSASGSPVAPGVAQGMNRGGTFDLPGAQSSFPNGINPGAQFAPAFNYGSIKAGYTNPATGKQILDPTITGATYNKQFLAQSQAAAANAAAKKKALLFAQRGY
jgi:hypothetical protein